MLDGFSFQDSVVKNLNGATGFKFSNGGNSGVRLSNLTISGNQFLNSTGDGSGDEYAFITLPPGTLSGENRISRNDIVRAASGQSIAIRWDGLTRSGTVPSGLSITDNFIDGYDSSIRLSRSGLTTVSGNTFGTRSGSQGRPATGEETGDGGALLVDNGTDSNLSVATWFPTSSAAVVAAPSSAALVATPRAGFTGGTCAAEFAVQRPVTGQNIPTGPVSLDLYWTADRTAEMSALPGVTLSDCGRKAGLNGVDNGRILFDSVRVPRTALLDRYAQVAEDGTYSSTITSANARFFTMLGALVKGRVSISGGSGLP